MSDVCEDEQMTHEPCRFESGVTDGEVKGVRALNGDLQKVDMAFAEWLGSVALGDPSANDFVAIFR
ncbi:MAG: hypothetical protein GWP91_01460 [Rhodobacterales bacterium]|nr:hypothetical protein [Rhodobacterales bacterium]